MKVNMNVVQNRVKVGILKSQDVAEIKLEVQFTEEEKYKIKKLGIQDYKFFNFPVLSGDKLGQRMQRDGAIDGNEIYIRNLIKGQWQPIRYENLHQANQAMNELEQQFRNLKNHLVDAEPESRSLDL